MLDEAVTFVCKPETDKFSAEELTFLLQVFKEGTRSFGKANSNFEFRLKLLSDSFTIHFSLFFILSSRFKPQK